jgi:exodeoxyribonuclease-3
MKLATWNVNSLAIRLPQVVDWVTAHQPDVLVLQETKLTDDKFPWSELRDAGYHAAFHGQKAYNGVALLSKVEPQDVVKNIPTHADESARVIAASIDGIRVIGGYFPNGQAPGSDKFEYKMQWLRGLRDWIDDELGRHPRLALLGDFNIAPEDCDVHDPVLLAGQILCTDEERWHFRKLLALGLHDAFRLFEQPPNVWSWWDYRMLAFQKNRGLRIDHVLVSEALKLLVRSCSIDRLPRKHARPSDHAPVMVELRL